MQTINTTPCEIAVAAIRGDYLSIRVDVDLSCEEGETPINLEDYLYSSELWEVTRNIDESNPNGGVVRVARVFDFTIELYSSDDPPFIVLSLDGSQTSQLKPEVPYRWDIRWYQSLSPDSVKTISYGPLVVK